MIRYLINIQESNRIVNYLKTPLFFHWRNSKKSISDYLEIHQLGLFGTQSILLPSQEHFKIWRFGFKTFNTWKKISVPFLMNLNKCFDKRWSQLLKLFLTITDAKKWCKMCYNVCCWHPINQQTRLNSKMSPWFTTLL